MSTLTRSEPVGADANDSLTRSIGTLPGVLAACAGLVLGGGTAGIAGTVLLVAAWALVPIQYAAAFGAVLAFATLEGAGFPAGAALGGIAIALAGSFARVDDGVGARVSFLLIAGALVAVPLAVALRVGTASGVLVLAVLSAGGTYFVHRYSLVRVVGIRAGEAESGGTGDDGAENEEEGSDSTNTETESSIESSDSNETDVEADTENESNETDVEADTEAERSDSNETDAEADTEAERSDSNETDVDADVEAERSDRRETGAEADTEAESERTDDGRSDA